MHQVNPHLYKKKQTNLGLAAPGCFGEPSSAGGTYADPNTAVANTDMSCCCLSETGA